MKNLSRPTTLLASALALSSLSSAQSVPAGTPSVTVEASPFSLTMVVAILLAIVAVAAGLAVWIRSRKRGNVIATTQDR